ncbi:MAG: FAD:protein FMN transferase [Gemmatimonadota bacterium]|nr:FAD:protein FMN transferase [Gemmatimonadota bacterium]
MNHRTAAGSLAAGLVGGVWIACANPRGPADVPPAAPPRAPSVSATASPVAALDHPDVIRREAWLMGTLLRVEVAAGDRAAATAAAEAALRAVEDLERELSSWREDSDLGRLRRAAPGERVPVAPRTARLVAEAAAWSRRTGGAFDPAVGALVDAWDLRGAGRVPAEVELAAARAASGPGRIEVSTDPPFLARRHPSAWLDAGGFGKGAALREAASALVAAGGISALLDFGGQLLAVGDPPAGGWPAAAAHPSRRDSAVVRLRLRRGSLATSGASERGIEVDGDRFGHLLDPRTGRPAPAWGSVTVAADDPLAADAIATALFVMGPAEGSRWLEESGVDAGAVLLVETERGVEVRRAGARDGRLSVGPVPESRASGAADAGTETTERTGEDRTT